MKGSVHEVEEGFILRLILLQSGIDKVHTKYIIITMNTAIINIKTESKLKKQAQNLAKELGFSLSSVLNAYLKQFVRSKSVNFSLLDESHPTKWGIKELKKSHEDVKAGRVSPVFTNAADAIKWLNSEDKGKI